MPHTESVFPLGVPIAPTEPADTNPTHIAEYGRGGLMSVADLTARDAIPSDRKKVGMLVYVQSEAKYFTLTTLPDTWTELSTGGTFVPTSVQSIYKTARNGSNTTSIPKGSVVFVSGSHASTELKVDLADADLEAASADTIGVAYETIAPNSSGLVQTFGYLSGITTNGVTGAEGSALYLSSTPGGFQTEIPVAPKHGVRIGFLVKKAGGGAGSIFVNVQNYQELAELSDVYIPTTPANNDTLIYDSTDARWENKKIPLGSLDTMNSAKLLGRRSSISGTPEEVTVGTGLKLSNTAVLSTDITASDIQSGTIAPARLGTGTANSTTFLRGDNTWASPGGGTLTVNTQDFTASGTWTKPANALWVEVTMCGAGENGNDGNDGAGGYGGRAGKIASKTFLASSLSSTVSVTCGTAQAKGASSTAQRSAFGDLLYADGGAQPGDAQGSTPEFVLVSAGNIWPMFGGCGPNDGDAGFHGAPFGPGGGGNGAPDAGTAGAGGQASTGKTDIDNNPASGGGGAGGANGTTGVAGTAGGYDTITGFGHGGGGGGQGTSGIGGAGGAAVRGGGGGGGGKCATGTGPSAGGAGGDGFVRVRTLCFG